MKRSEKLRKQSLYIALEGLFMLTVALFTAIWGYACLQEQNLACLGLWVITFISLLSLSVAYKDCKRHRDLARNEEAYERRDEIRQSI